MLLRRVLSRRLVRVSIETEVLRRVLRRGGVIEGAQKAETHPFAEYDPLRVHPKHGKRARHEEKRCLSRSFFRERPKRDNDN